MVTARTEVPIPCPKCGKLLVFSMTKIEGAGATGRLTCYGCGYNQQDGMSEEAAQRMSRRSTRSDPESDD